MYTTFTKGDRLKQNATISLSTDPQQNFKIQLSQKVVFQLSGEEGALGVKSDSKHLLSLVLIGLNEVIA